MEKQIIYQDNREIFESERDFKDAQHDVNEFLVEAKKCKIQINDIPELIALIHNPKAESDRHYMETIKEEDIPGTELFKQTKAEFFKTLDLPNRDKLVNLAIKLQSRTQRLPLGTLSKDKLIWDQVKFDEHKNSFIVRDDSELAGLLLGIAGKVEKLRDYFERVGKEKNMNISILNRLLPSLPGLLIESGKKVYVNPDEYNSLKEALK